MQKSSDNKAIAATINPTIKANALMRFWNAVVESISGNDQDFTTGKLSRAIFLLSLPMVLEMLMESTFAIVDIYFVSQLGASAVAAVGITESLMTLVYAMGVGLSAAATAVVARRIGEKNKDGAAEAAVQAIFTAIAISLVFAIPGIFFSKDLLRLMGASPEVINNGWLYTSTMISFNMVIMLLFINNAIFRSAGDAAISMRVLWIGNLINIVLDPCLIFGLGPFPKLGIFGAALATNIGRGIAVIYQFYILFNGSGRIHLKWHNIRLKPKVMANLIKLSLGGIGQHIIATAGWIGLMRIMATFGSQVLAAYTIAIRIIIFALLPSWGLSNAASTLVGQNLGAGKPERAEKAVWATGLINMAFLGIIAIFFIVFPTNFVGLLTNSDEIIAMGAVCLRTVSYGFILYALGMIIMQSFNGAGDTVTPTLLNFFCFWILEIPLAYFLALKIGLQENGVYIAIVTAESLVAILGFLLFRRGKWKLLKV